MKHLFRFAAAAAVILLPMTAAAGGYIGPVSCAELVDAGRLQTGVQCQRGSGVYQVETAHAGASATGIRGYYYRLIRHVPATEVVYGKRCPYPHRPSDSVFSGGAGYIIKDTVRARIGCVY